MANEWVAQKYIAQNSGGGVQASRKMQTELKHNANDAQQCHVSVIDELYST